MATFILIPTDQTPAQMASLAAQLAQRFGNAAFSLPKGECLVSYEGTSKQLSDELMITEGTHGGCVVLNFSGYWGRATQDVWEWLEVNQK